MASKTTKAVVTGGAGFIGSHLVDFLIEQDWSVTVIDNLSGGKMENVNSQARLKIADIRDYSKIQPFFRGADYVFHLAALPQVEYSIEHPEETNEVNVTGTLNVLRAARAAKVKRVIYAASSSAYGDPEILPLAEDLSARPKSPYGLQKYIGELYCQLFSLVYHLPTVCLRLFNVYGPRQNPNGAYALVIGKFLKQKQERKPLTVTGDGKQTRDFIHVRDVVWANWLAALSERAGRGEVINIGASRNYSIKKLAALIGGPVRHIAPRLEPKDTLADNRRAKQLLEWEPAIAIEEGIAELKREILAKSNE